LVAVTTLVEEDVTGLKPQCLYLFERRPNRSDIGEVQIPALHVRHSQVRNLPMNLTGARLEALRDTALQLAERSERGPGPTLGQARQLARIQRLRLLVLLLPAIIRRGLGLGLQPLQLLGLPARPALAEGTLEEDVGGLVVAALAAGELRLGRDEPALAGGL